MKSMPSDIYKFRAGTVTIQPHHFFEWLGVSQM